MDGGEAVSCQGNISVSAVYRGLGDITKALLVLIAAWRSKSWNLTTDKSPVQDILTTQAKPFEYAER